MKDVPKFVRQRMAAPAAGDHPEANLLAAFAEGGLTSREREQVLSHLGTCATCRETLAVAMPAIAAAHPQVIAAPSGTRWLRWPMLRWAGVGAAVVVVAAAVVIQSSRRPAEIAKISVAAPAEKSELAKEPAKRAVAGEVAPVSADRESRKEAAPSRDLQAKAKRRADSKKDAVAGQFAKDVPAPGPAKAAANEVAKNNAPAQLQAETESSAAAQPARVQQRGSALVAGVAGAVAMEDKQQQPQAAASAPAAPSANETVEVAAESSVARTYKAKAQDHVQSDLDGMKAAHGGPAAKARAIPGGNSASVTGSPISADSAAMTAVPAMKAALAVAPRWRLSTEGTLERSTDAGRTWQLVRVAAPAPALRSFSALDHDIWAGGAGGALYHSADNGRTWARVAVTAGAVVLDADIMRVEFTDAQHGALTTVSGETWTTADAGLNWSVRR